MTLSRSVFLFTITPLLILFVLLYTLEFNALLPGVYRLVYDTKGLAGQLSSLLHRPGTSSQHASVKPFVRHIVAVGDLHGDLPNARRVLHFSGIVDEYGNWTGHADFFVQTGDIIDRYGSHCSADDNQRTLPRFRKGGRYNRAF